MIKWPVLGLFVLILLITACNQEHVKPIGENPPIKKPDVTPSKAEEASETGKPEDVDDFEGEMVKHELLFHLEYMPHEVGTRVSVIQDEQLYNKWAEIFEFEYIPAIDFTTEEVLFVTSYSNGCGVVFENVTKQEGTLLVKLNYPEDILANKEIECTDIAMPHSFVVKMEKIGATHATLMEANRVLLEKESVLQ